MSSPARAAPMSPRQLRSAVAKAERQLQRELDDLTRHERDARAALGGLRAQAKRELGAVEARMARRRALAGWTRRDAEALALDLEALDAERRELAARFEALEHQQGHALQALGRERERRRREQAALTQVAAELTREREIEAVLAGPRRQPGDAERVQIDRLGELAKALDRLRRPDQDDVVDRALRGLQRALDTKRLERGAPLGAPRDLPTTEPRDRFEDAELLIEAQEDAFAKHGVLDARYVPGAPAGALSGRARQALVVLLLCLVTALTGALLAVLVAELSPDPTPTTATRDDATTSVAERASSSRDGATASSRDEATASSRDGATASSRDGATASLTLAAKAPTPPPPTARAPSRTRSPPDRSPPSERTTRLRDRVERAPRDVTARLALARVLVEDENPLGAWRHLVFIETLAARGAPDAKRALARARRDPDLVTLLDTVPPAGDADE